MTEFYRLRLFGYKKMPLFNGIAIA